MVGIIDIVSGFNSKQARKGYIDLRLYTDDVQAIQIMAITWHFNKFKQSLGSFKIHCGHHIQVYEAFVANTLTKFDIIDKLERTSWASWDLEYLVTARIIIFTLIVTFNVASVMSEALLKNYSSTLKQVILSNSGDASVFPFIQIIGDYENFIRFRFGRWSLSTFTPFITLQISTGFSTPVIQIVVMDTALSQATNLVSLSSRYIHAMVGKIHGFENIDAFFAHVRFANKARSILPSHCELRTKNELVTRKSAPKDIRECPAVASVDAIKPTIFWTGVCLQWTDEVEFCYNDTREGSSNLMPVSCSSCAQHLCANDAWATDRFYLKMKSLL